MRIACLQHVAFEGPAAIGIWAASRGYPVSVTRLFANEPPPALDDFDLLVILGGPMSANDAAQYDWMRAETQFIQHAMAKNKRVLGFCLGAQLIASALGAKVFPNCEREVGWFPVQRTPESSGHPAFASLPKTLKALHWHGETFDLPNDAIWLAQSKGCKHQAFAVGPHILGLQFHLECTAEGVEALIHACPADLAPGRFVQAASEILSAPQHFQQCHQWLGMLLDRY